MIPRFDPLTSKHELADSAYPLVPGSLPGKNVTDQTPLDIDLADFTMPLQPKQDILYPAPSYIPSEGKSIKPTPLDTKTDTGSPLVNYYDLVDCVVRCLVDYELDSPVPLSQLIDTSKIAHQRLPQQSEIDLLMKEIQTKILRQVHLLTSFRDLHGAYLDSPHF